MNTNSRTSVLFVCMGNICRSPTAEGVMRHALVARQLDHGFEIDSAGTHAYHAGEPPDPRAQRAAAERGIDLSDLRARRVTELDFERFDLILAMDEHNRSELEAIAEPHQHAKIRLFLEFGAGGTGTEVPDPYYGGPLGFQKVLDLVEDTVDRLIDELSARTAR